MGWTYALLQMVLTMCCAAIFLALLIPKLLGWQPGVNGSEWAWAPECGLCSLTACRWRALLSRLPESRGSAGAVEDGHVSSYTSLKQEKLS